MIRQVFQLINKTTVGRISLYVLAWIGTILLVLAFAGLTGFSILLAIGLCVEVAVQATPWLLILLIPLMLVALLVGNVWFWITVHRQVLRPINEYLDF